MGDTFGHSRTHDHNTIHGRVLRYCIIILRIKRSVAANDTHTSPITDIQEIIINNSSRLLPPFFVHHHYIYHPHHNHHQRTLYIISLTNYTNPPRRPLSNFYCLPLVPFPLAPLPHLFGRGEAPELGERTTNGSSDSSRCRGALRDSEPWLGFLPKRC